MKKERVKILEPMEFRRMRGLLGGTMEVFEFDPETCYRGIIKKIRWGKDGRRRMAPLCTYLTNVLKYNPATKGWARICFSGKSYPVAYNGIGFLAIQNQNYIRFCTSFEACVAIFPKGKNIPDGSVLYRTSDQPIADYKKLEKKLLKTLKNM